MDNDIISVVIVVRHGARFPYKSSQGNLSFPNSNDFWSKCGMMLTPAGSNQLIRLGNSLAGQYPNLINNVKAYSSYTSRTIMSAKALLNGMLPDTPVYITHNGDRCKKDYDGLNLGIEIKVEESKEHDTLFHLGRHNKQLREWKSSNMKYSDEMTELSRRTDCINLFDKLFTITMCQNMSPNESNLKRLRKITEYVTLVRYARCSNTLLLPNKFLLFLTEDEIKLIEYLGNIVYRHHYSSHDGDIDDSTGAYCSGLLINTILDGFRDNLSKFKDNLYEFRDNMYSMRIFSGHDTTLLSLAAALGVSVSAPNFSAYFIFELHRDGSIHIKYNPEPDEIKLKDLVSKEWVNSNRIIEFGKLTESKGCSIDSLGEISDLRSYILLKNKLLGDNVKLDVHKVERLFKYYDTDNDGYLNSNEFRAMIRRFEIDLSDSDIDNMFDQISIDGKIYPEDLI